MAVTKRWLVLFLVGILPIMLSGTNWGGTMAVIAFAWYFGLTVLVIADRKLTPSTSEISVRREMGDKLSLGAENTITLSVRNSSDQRLQLTLTDSYPISMRISQNSTDGPAVVLTVKPHSRSTTTYTVKPSQRGNHQFGDIYLAVRGRLGMIERVSPVEAGATVKVYPNLANRVSLI